MKPSVLLRVASVLSFLYFLGHSAGFPWTPADGPQATAVVEAMKRFQFEVVGRSRTYWDFYQGFGVTISVQLLVQTLVLWHLGTVAKTDPARVRPLVAVFAVAMLINAILATRYFFPIPLIFAGAISVCLGIAVGTAPRAMSRHELKAKD